MSKKIQYFTTMRAELSPDCYSGDSGEDLKFLWEVSAEGDMDSEKEEILTLDAKQFPPGTKITIEVPECPECGTPSEFCILGQGEPESNCPDCGFDWEEWTQNKYS